MRTTMFFLALLASGCSTTPTTTVPVPQAARDGKTPVGLMKSNVSQRIIEHRMQEGQIAQGKLAVDGQLLR